MSKQSFMPARIADFRAFVKVRDGGRFDLMTSRGRIATGLDDEDFMFVVRNFKALEAQAQAEDKAKVAT